MTADNCEYCFSEKKKKNHMAEFFIVVQLNEQPWLSFSQEKLVPGFADEVSRHVRENFQLGV